MAFKVKILFIHMLCDLWKWSRPLKPYNTWQVANSQTHEVATIYRHFYDYKIQVTVRFYGVQ
jgi:hypothetical protein